jgi:hypothetical protein
MIEFSKIGVGELQIIADYLLQNKSKVEQVIFDFGDIEKDNGYGTLFLHPKNPLFKVISVHVKDGQISSVGIGGPQLGLSLKDLVFAYQKNSEGFVPYDSEHVYVFNTPGDFKYTVKITSKDKLLENREIINDIPINRLVITLK